MGVNGVNEVIGLNGVNEVIGLNEVIEVNGVMEQMSYYGIDIDIIVKLGHLEEVEHIGAQIYICKSGAYW